MQVAAIPYGRHRKVFCRTMKIYLGFTVAGNRSSIEAAKKLLKVLQSLGHEVLTSHVVSEDARNPSSRFVLAPPTLNIQRAGAGLIPKR